MKSSYTAAEVTDALLSVERPTRLNKIVLVVEEEYTPMDYLAQRYSVTLHRNGSRGSVLLRKGDIIDIVGTCTKLIKLYDIKSEDILVKIP